MTQSVQYDMIIDSQRPMASDMLRIIVQLIGRSHDLSVPSTSAPDIGRPQLDKLAVISSAADQSPPLSFCLRSRHRRCPSDSAVRKGIVFAGMFISSLLKSSLLHDFLLTYIELRILVLLDLLFCRVK